MFPPPMMKISESVSFPISIASCKESARKVPSERHSSFRVITILMRLGSGFPMESKVFLPIMTGCPEVRFLKCFKSFGKCQINSLLLPMTLFSDFATTIVITNYVSSFKFKVEQKTSYFQSSNTLFYRFHCIIQQFNLFFQTFGWLRLIGLDFKINCLLDCSSHYANRSGVFFDIIVNLLVN